MNSTTFAKILGLVFVGYVAYVIYEYQKRPEAKTHDDPIKDKTLAPDQPTDDKNIIG